MTQSATGLITELFERLEIDSGQVRSVETVSQSASTKVLHVTTLGSAHSQTSAGHNRPSEFCVKRTSPQFAEHLACEAEGLRLIGETGQIHVPRVFHDKRQTDTKTAAGITIACGNAWLVSQWITPDASLPAAASTNQPDSQTDCFFARFGRRLAAMHRATTGRRIGLHRDNYLGPANQINLIGQATSPEYTHTGSFQNPAAELGWTDFVAQCRLGTCLGRAIDDGVASDRLKQAVEKIVDRLPDLLSGRSDETSLLHGDLWSGNYLPAADQTPVLIDPAVYYGCREAEFGMLRLYGNCPSEFYDAYQEAWPMPSGWQRRTKVYVLYHLLNHMNLFGSGYLNQSEQTAESILQTKT